MHCSLAGKVWHLYKKAVVYKKYRYVRKSLYNTITYQNVESTLLTGEMSDMRKCRLHYFYEKTIGRTPASSSIFTECL